MLLPDESRPSAFHSQTRGHDTHRGQTSAEVFATILLKGPLTRTELATHTSLSPATITKLVAPMLQDGLVLEDAEDRDDRPGRPARPIHVNKNRLFVFGVKLIGPVASSPDKIGQVIGAITNLGAEVVASDRWSLWSTEPDEVIRTVASLVRKLRKASPKMDKNLIGIGADIGGHVDSVAGEVRFSPSFKWRNVPLAARLTDATGLHSVVQNNVKSYAILEQWFGEGRMHSSYAVVLVGSRFGAGVILNNQLFYGGTGLAGEIGHIVVEPDGPECRCGNRGCLWSVASHAGILRSIQAGGGPQPGTIEEAIRLADAGNRAARRAFERGGDALGRALSTLLNLLNPSRIVLIGDGVIASTRPNRSYVVYSDLFMDNMLRAMDKYAYGSAFRDCELVIHRHSEWMSARAAAAVVLRDFITNRLGRFSERGAVEGH
jgi:predicted NBD/HSP70 family sugar kinase